MLGNSGESSGQTNEARAPNDEKLHKPPSPRSMPVVRPASPSSSHNPAPRKRERAEASEPAWSDAQSEENAQVPPTTTAEDQGSNEEFLEARSHASSQSVWSDEDDFWTSLWSSGVAPDIVYDLLDGGPGLDQSGLAYVAQGLVRESSAIDLADRP